MMMINDSAMQSRLSCGRCFPGNANGGAAVQVSRQLDSQTRTNRPPSKRRPMSHFARALI